MIALSEEPRLITKVTSCQDAVEPRSPFHETRIAGRDSGVCHVLVRKRQLFCREKGLLKRLHAVIPERHSNQLGKDLITLDVDIIGKMRLGVMTGKGGNSFVCNNHRNGESGTDRRRQRAGAPVGEQGIGKHVADYPRLFVFDRSTAALRAYPHSTDTGNVAFRQVVDCQRAKVLVVDHVKRRTLSARPLARQANQVADENLLHRYIPRGMYQLVGQRLHTWKSVGTMRDILTDI